MRSTQSPSSRGTTSSLRVNFRFSLIPSADFLSKSIHKRPAVVFAHQLGHDTSIYEPKIINSPYPQLRINRSHVVTFFPHFAGAGG